jgi:beta-fructofuranosidase
MGDWWYIVYSEGYRASWSRKVKYMMAPTFEDLKACFNDPGANWPKDGKEGVLDSRAFYAAKTASNGTDRLIWGWCPYRTGADIHEKNLNVGAGDGNEPNWSGALVCHKIIQHADGTLTLGEVPAMASKYDKAQALNVMECNGYDNGTLSGDNAYVLYNRLGTSNHISFTVKTSNNWDKFGISLVRHTDIDYYYTLVVNPEDENHRKVNFEQEGFRMVKVYEDGVEKEVRVNGCGFVEGIDGYWFERPQDNVYHIDIYTDNSVLVLYINDVCAYTQRIYGIQKNCWSINNYGGSVTVSDVKVYQQ